MNASNNYRTGALMENLEGRRFFSANGGEHQPAMPPIESSYSDVQMDQTATFNRNTVVDHSPVLDGPVNDGSTAVA